MLKLAVVGVVTNNFMLCVPALVVNKIILVYQVVGDNTNNGESELLAFRLRL